ncbi:MAG: hypothetical protein ACN6O1_13985 [Comamonas sp.]|uniref:hypothetical protein n=1 Tax=Comamonas sp. TaxID=34028 RepID=UPI003D110DEF
MSKTSHTSPSSPPPGQQDLGACLAAPAKVDQEGGTIPQPYLDYSISIPTLWEMVDSAKNCREKDALICSIAAITTLLMDRGYDV